MKRNSAYAALVLAVVFSLQLFFRIPGVWGVKCPSVIRVGLTGLSSPYTVTIISGNYRMYAGSDTTPLLTPAPGTGWQLSYTLDQSMISISSVNGDASSSTAGAFNSISLVPDSYDFNQVISINGKTYRGALRFKVNGAGNGVQVINELPLDQYLYGVVPREASNQWPLEALKAQSVAARTYVVKNINKHGASGFDVCDQTHCQVYGGYSCEGDNARHAVDATSRQVLVDERGTLIYALYHSNSGGHTEDNVNVNGYVYSYLQGKPDPYSMGYGLCNWFYRTQVTMNGTGSSMYEQLKTRFPELAPIAGFALTKFPSGRVSTVTIIDENGQQWTLSGREFGQLFNPGFNTSVNENSFMSIMFDVETDARVSILNGSGKLITQDGQLKTMYVRSASSTTQLRVGDNYFQAKSANEVKIIPKSPQNASFIGHGWGHGVGMSQWGAYGMALQGKTYRDILQFYYEGARLVNLE